MPRPTPIIIPGPVGMGGNFRQSEVDLSGLSKLVLGLFEQKRQEAQMTEGAKTIAGWLGIGQPTPAQTPPLPGGTQPAFAVNAPAAPGQTGEAISAPEMKPGWGEKAYQSPLVQQGLLEIIKNKYGAGGNNLRNLNFDTFTDKEGTQWRIGYNPLTGEEISRTRQGEGKENIRDAYKNDAVMTRIVNAFNADPAVRKVEQMDEFSQLIVNVAASDNPIGHASLETLMARASGEVGNLSEADKKPFGGSRALSEKMKQYFSELYKGKKTPENLGFISQLAKTFQETGRKKKASLARERANQYARANKGMGWTAEDIFKTLAPFESYSKQEATSVSTPLRKQGTDGKWYVNDGKGWRPE